MWTKVDLLTQAVRHDCGFSRAHTVVPAIQVFVCACQMHSQYMSHTQLPPFYKAHQCDHTSKSLQALVNDVQNSKVPLDKSAGSRAQTNSTICMSVAQHAAWIPAGSVKDLQNSKLPLEKAQEPLAEANPTNYMLVAKYAVWIPAGPSEGAAERQAAPDQGQWALWMCWGPQVGRPPSHGHLRWWHRGKRS